MPQVELIEAKLENRRPHEIDEPERGGKVIDLLEALKCSVKSKLTRTKSTMAKTTSSGKGRAKSTTGVGAGRAARGAGPLEADFSDCLGGQQ